MRQWRWWLRRGLRQLTEVERRKPVTLKSMTRSARNRLVLAREFGRTGVWLALVLTVSAWVSVGLTLAPARAALNGAQHQLSELDSRLQDAQAALAPFDLLSRPETLGAVKTLNDLAKQAESIPLVNHLFGKDNLRDAVALTADWEQNLQDRPPLPALADAREAVQDWRTRVQHFQERLTLLALGACVLFTLLGAWFAAGQWALYQQASQGLREFKLEEITRSK